ncbi:MAG: site-specific integrase [Pseudomonadota bacterium]|nr:site-specific integrase [Pseudomonadota bacterium]
MGRGTSRGVGPTLGAGVRQASASSIAITFEYRGVRCRETIKLPPNSANLRFVGNLKARIEHEIAVGTFDYGKHFPNSKHARKLARVPAQTITVGDLLTDWLRDVSKELEPETYGDYAEYVARTWRPLFGKDRLSDLTSDRIHEWIAKQTTSKKRILNVLTPLRQALRYAVHPRGLLPTDPIGVLKIKRRAVAQKKVEVDAFSAAEIAAVLAKLEAPVANMFQFWVWTGLREGELIALTWADIDFERGVAIINKAARGGRRKATKTVAGNREVKLLPPALEALQRQKPLTRLLHKEIFLNPGSPGTWGRNKAAVNQPWGNDKAIRLRWAEACKAAGVRYRFPRQLRHTYATWMLMSREDPLWVSRQLGHENVGVTLKHYAKYVPSMNPNAGMGAYQAIIGSRLGHD